MIGRKISITLPFRYPGGKYYAIKKLRIFWESVFHDEYREPFLGGGSIFWAKDLVQHNWINDIDEDLIRILKFIKTRSNLEDLLNLFVNEKESTRKKYQEIRDLIPETELEKVYKYYYINRTSYSGKMISPSWGYRPKRSLPPYRWHERLIPCAEKIQDVKITSVDFQEAIITKKLGKNVLMFLDPPYFDVKQNSHYRHPFTKYDHIRLNSLLKTSNHSFFLTYDDTPEIRKMYSWANIYKLDFFYRIDNSNDNKDKRKIGNEIVITNYDVPSLNPLKQMNLFSSSGNGVSQPKKIKHSNTPVIEKIRSPIRFPGSKLQAIKFIAPFWESIKHDEYREPFLGGGAVFFAKPLLKVNWINDIDIEIINLYKIMADTSQRPELIKRVQKFIPNKDNFNKLRETNPKSEMGRAYKYFVINRTAYSGIMNKPNWGYDNKKSVPPKRWGERIQNAGQKLNFAKITNYHFREIILQKSKHPVFLFVDPPYMKADQKRAYFHSFQLNDHIELEKLLNKTPYSFCLTYDNCDEARDLYSWANIHDFSWRYHTANSKVATRKMGKELIITNF